MWDERVGVADSEEGVLCRGSISDGKTDAMVVGNVSIENADDKNELSIGERKKELKRAAVKGTKKGTKATHDSQSNVSLAKTADVGYDYLLELSFIILAGGQISTTASVSESAICVPALTVLDATAATACSTHLPGGNATRRPAPSECLHP